MNVKCPNCGYTDQVNSALEVECPFCHEGVLKEFTPEIRQFKIKPSTTEKIKTYMENMHKAELIK